jgi:hypothetical protein
VILGAVAMVVTLFAPTGLWGAVSARWDISLLRVGYRYRRQ